MTATRAKGKEYDSVFLLDVNDGIWPSKLAITSDELEQERKLFYVAITRVKKVLTILVNEKIFDMSVQPSRYLEEMGLENKITKIGY